MRKTRIEFTADRKDAELLAKAANHSSQSLASFVRTAAIAMARKLIGAKNA